MSGWQTWTWLAFALCVIILVAWRLTYTAARLDRLHARVEGSVAALDAQLVRRADAAMDVARLDVLDPASALLVASAAASCLDAAEGARVVDDVQERGIASERAAAESELTALLAVVVRDGGLVTGDVGEPDTMDACRRLADACDRVELAARFYDEAVRDVRRVRAKTSVRVFRLAGRTHLPRPVDFDVHVDGLSHGSSWR